METHTGRGNGRAGASVSGVTMPRSSGSRMRPGEANWSHTLETCLTIQNFGRFTLDKIFFSCE